MTHVHLIERSLSDAKYRGLLEAAPDAMVVVDEGGEIVLLNVRAEQQFGYHRDELVGQKVANIIPEGFAERLIADGLRSAADALAQQIGTGIELVGRRKNGTEFPIEIMLSPLENPDGILVTAAIRDISVRKQSELEFLQKVQELNRSLNCIGDSIVCTDISGIITFLNMTAEKVTGWPLEEATGRNMAEVFPILDAVSGRKVSIRQLSGTTPPECVLVPRHGAEIPIDVSVAPLLDDDGILSGMVSVFRDVTASRAMSRAIAYTAEHDSLTGLPNRALLNDRIGQAIALAARRGTQVAILFLDVDGFKHINDSLGHSTGDGLLRSLSDSLVSVVRSGDTVSRQGGDEFVLLITEPDQWTDVNLVAERALQAASQTHVVGGHELQVTASIGVSIYPQDGTDAETLIKNADTAMYQAKADGRQSIRFFEAQMNIRAVQRQEIEKGLRTALAKGHFCLHYQPVWDLRTGAISGAEALVRWADPVHGMVPPGDFIPIAEDCGLILPIGHWVLREACRQMRTWLDAGLLISTIAVNVSAKEFTHDRFLGGVFTALREAGLPPSCLVLELTESVMMERFDTAVTVLHTLRNEGIRVALDDFGTGYSSLSYLQKFPVDALKIDQSFVRQISDAGESTTIVCAIIDLARSLKVCVIAEGVETIEELDFLRTQNCDQAQGFYLSRPVPASELVKLLKKPASKMAA